MTKKQDKEPFSVILTHENTDFDGLASLLAASKLYPEAIPVLPQRLNRNLRAFLSIYGDELPFVRREDVPKRRVDKAIWVDTQSAVPVKGINKRTAIQIIDHHPLDRPLEQGMVYHGGDVGATTTLLLEGIREKRTPLPLIEAALLLLGIYEDTGSLTYTATTARDIYAAAWLLEQVEPGEHPRLLALLNKYLRQPMSEEQMAVYTQLVEKGEIHRLHGYVVFVAAIPLEGYVEELSTPAHKVNDLLDPDASFMFFSHREEVQLVARSTTEAIDVAEIARHFGGGGHSKAAAARIEDMGLAEAKEKLLELLKYYVRPPVVVRDIMSFGVHTLDPDMTVEEAEQAMRRYGHEGFPVLDQGKLVGLLTRREIEKAIDHQLGKTRIAVYMRKGDIHVQPGDSVAQVQQVMTEHDLGQIPVVEDGKVIGIVTRTDLIKLWSTPSPRSSRQDIITRFEEILPAPQRDLILKARDVANSMGYSLYIVGGFVRDLMLGVPDLDFDLVVEGDAIRVARKLAAQIGGRAISHSRFGTAKVILEGTEGTNLPKFLDLATARTEFYERPSALPRVESSSIKQDLHRRDFTINTMAICLDQSRYGELLDFYGAEKDLKQGLIRVLHNLSFIDDSTRILRAVRLEQRLGFKIERQTAELVDDALGVLDRVTGERLRNELTLIFREKEPAKSWQRLAELGVLQHIHPALQDNAWLQAKFRELRAAWLSWYARPLLEVEGDQFGETPPELLLSQQEAEAFPAILYWGLVTFRMTESELAALLGRLKMMQRDVKCLWEVKELSKALAELGSGELLPSRLYRLLEPYSEEAIFVVYVASDKPTVRQNIENYQRRLRWVRPQIDGAYLRELGLKPGPIYRQILEQVQDALLENRVRTRGEQEALAKELVKTAS